MDYLRAGVSGAGDGQADFWKHLTRETEIDADIVGNIDG
jgi:hypothetical protein